MCKLAAMFTHRFDVHRREQEEICLPHSSLLLIRTSHEGRIPEAEVSYDSCGETTWASEEDVRILSDTALDDLSRLALAAICETPFSSSLVFDDIFGVNDQAHGVAVGHRRCCGERIAVEESVLSTVVLGSYTA